MIRTERKPVPIPIILGHGGAGIITEIGEVVSTFKVGQRVGFEALLREKLPDFYEGEWQLKKNTTVKKLLEELNITNEESILVFINGRKTNNESLIRNVDSVNIFPLLGGGYG